MAKMTTTQRKAIQDAEKAAYEAIAKESYPQRLMEMLEGATIYNYQISVFDGKFVLLDTDNVHEKKIELTLTYNKENQEALHELEWRLDEKKAKAEEAKRRYELRIQALAKLTSEERKELGL